MSDIRIKRIYDGIDSSDGARILVDRLWPRGVSKDGAQLTRWMKEVAPSAALRTWFGHRPEKFEAFRTLYTAELEQEAVQPYLEQLIRWSREGRVTLLYAAKDEQCNHAVLLKEYLEAKRRETES
ncbi:DUF488 family protein [Paenibacillus doosanensis]|uniref:Uroporphyrin-III C-methyltransferase n=1 Tax=Paenibacillus konkukensis TaxID=2020716 RepID=A0ABY4RG41_9BACL|nr:MULTISPECIES: DUF488 family protein [Paenibacillus]MCS7460535.1 DUF488 family protein [Paenibacillus doosanensis]UQZ81243.1 hypothetical protein SK3146_00399 [Paenibacillus konkukensis]